MAYVSHVERASIAALIPVLNVQDNGFISSQVGHLTGIRRRMHRLLSSSPSLWNNKNSSISRFKDRHGFSSLLKHLSARHKSKHYQTKVCIAADFPDAKPDASCLGDLGYHPLEEISNFERKKNIEHTDQRLTDAEIARTLTEINEKAVFFPLLWNDEDPIFGTEARFLVDEHGDFYFQTDDDGEFLETINDAGNQMNVSIGYDSIEDWILEHQEAQDEIVHNDSDDDSSDLDNDEEEEEWSIITTKDTKLMLGLGKESSEYLGDWSGFDSLRYIHPLDFADSLSSAALADNEVKIKKPSQSIRIIGEVQRLHGEEEKYVEQLFQDRFGNDSEEKNNNDSDTDDAKQSPGLVTGTPTGQEDNESVINSSTYRGLVGSTMEISIAQKSAHSKSSEKSMLWPSEAGIGDSDDDIIMEFTVISPMDGDTEVEESEEDESDENESGVSFYKLDIQSIRVISFFGAQLLVDKVEFRAAKPDILARVGPDIIERLNTRGKVLEDALKSVCLHRKGLKVEEVMLLHLDSLGMDLRVHCGREIKTLRISFGQQAKTEGHAEKLLNELLFPETPRKGRQKRRSWP